MIESLSKRTDYPSLLDYTYLNQASLGLIGTPAVEAMNDFLYNVARHGNLKMSDEQELNFLNQLKRNIAKLLNAKEEHVAIMGSASEMLGQLPYIFKPKKNTKIVAVSTDFPALTRPWISYCKIHSCEMHFVQDDKSTNLTEQIIQAIDKRTAIVTVSLVQFSTGTKIDIQDLVAATKQAGAKLIIDITQAAGAIPISARNIDADVLVCSGYKWLGGHGGIGIALTSPEFLKKDPIMTGWMGAPDPFNMQAKHSSYSQDARKYTMATMSYISIKGLEVAVNELLNLNITNVSIHANKLKTLLSNQLEETRWNLYRAKDDVSASSHIISIESLSKNIRDNFEKLKTNTIICGIRNNRIRISISHYNNQTDIEKLINALN